MNFPLLNISISFDSDLLCGVFLSKNTLSNIVSTPYVDIIFPEHTRPSTCNLNKLLLPCVIPVVVNTGALLFVILHLL
uniref:Uncharacterized protein n=1 Tax=viral metagenome TaxID=1070528 RepID=A0A6C0EJ33_9ZZZZ